MKKPTIPDPAWVIETPDVLSRRVALANASEEERPAAQAALDRALAARQEDVLDAVTDRILRDVQVLENLIFDPKVETASDRLKAAIDFVLDNFSEAEMTVAAGHSTAKRALPRGAVLTDACKRRGPLVAVARALVDLIPIRTLLEYARDLALIKEVRKARQKPAKEKVTA